MERTPWSKVIFVYAAALTAAMGLGKIAPVAPLIQDDLALSLTEIGWALSAIAGVAAVVGTPVGLWTRWLGNKRALIIGLGLLAVASMAGMFASKGATLLATRLLEGFGYVLVITAGANLTAALTRGRDQASALALWGTFVPVGLALAAGLGAGLAPVIGWRGWLGVAGGLPALFLLGTIFMIPGSSTMAPAQRPRSRPPLMGPAMLAFGFGALSLAGISVLGLLTLFLVEVRGAGLAEAGAATALVSMCSVPGSIIAGLLMRRGIGIGALSLGALVMPLAAVPAFLTHDGLALSIGGAGLILVSNGLVVAALFAAVPRLVSDPAHLGLANGMVAQCGSLGSLVGPPLFGLVAATGGWPALVPMILAVTLLGLVFVFAALRARPTRAPVSA